MRRGDVAGNARGHDERKPVRPAGPVLDAAAQIRLLRKLKLTHCARPSFETHRYAMLLRMRSVIDLLLMPHPASKNQQTAASRKARSIGRLGCAFPVSGLYFQEAIDGGPQAAASENRSERFDFLPPAR
jgi:hypothetical protein